MMDNTKIKVPDGSGGWKEVDAIKHEGSTQDIDKAAKVLADTQAREYFERIGRMTEAINRFINNWGKEAGFEPAEVAGAVFLESCNIRANFPEGSAAYDDICKVIAEWYKEQTS